MKINWEFLTWALNGGQFDAPVTYLRGSSPQYSFDRMVGGPQRQYGHYGVKENLLSVPEIESPRFKYVARRFTEGDIPAP